jgi:hypothetical protein
MPLVLSGSNGISTNGTTWALQPDSAGRTLTPNRPVFRASLSQLITYTSGWSKLQCQSTVNNIGGSFSLSTSRFTAPVNGFYQFNLSASFNGVENDGTLAFAINGDVNSYLSVSIANIDAAYTGAAVSHIIYLNTNDYVEPWKYNAQNIQSRSNAWAGAFSGFLVG